MKKRIIVLFLLIVSFFDSWGQRGKDGVGNIVAANTIVNIYIPLTASVNAGVATISVGSTAGFSVGDLIFIIQMQGATVNAYSNFPWIDPTMGMPNDTSMGYIQNYNNCGNHEFAQINAVLSGTSFSLDCALMKNYTNTGNVQVVRVPRYSALTVSGAGNITCPPWNGSVGGVVVVEVETNATLSSVPSFNVSNKGFRGGGVENASTVSGANKFGSTRGLEGGYKGESIAGDTNTYKSWSVVFCKGAIANGGGGGTAHNAGGGGGANGGSTAAYNGYGNPTAGYATAWNLESAGFSGNVSSGGGRGGYTFSSSNQNPNTFGPSSGGWSGDGRRNNGGFGGRPLDYSTGRLFIGGGGGTGDSNDNYGAAAGNGGGMVYVLCYGNTSGAGTILADGGNGGNSVITGGCSGRDGGSGGGGGGTVILNIVGTTNLTAAPAIFARGGAGGNQNFGAPCFNTEAYGPGAGGGGGYIGYTGALPLNAINGGTNGIVSGNSGLIRTNFPPNGATMGGIGSSASMTAARTITATPTTTICVNNSATLFAGTNASPATINWYSTIAGGSPIGTGSPFTTSVITVPGTYTVYAGYCQGGTYRVPSVITVITGPTLTVNSASICSGQTATLSAGGATTYTWNTGAFTSSIAVNPVATTVYTVSGTIATCTAAITTTVSMLSAPVLVAPAVNICNGQTATLTAAGATNYTWSTGGIGASITVTPAVNTTYTVTGSNGACTSSITTNVTVNAAPVVTSNTVTICSGQTATLTGAGASSYTWSTGPTTSSITVSPATSTNYTVIGSNGTCTNTAVASVIVVPSLTVTATSATICQGGTATLTASGAATYTWSTTQTTSSISVSPAATTIYTVIGSSGTCSSSATASVLVNSNPTVTVNSATICSGQTATLNALGATSYTWNPGGLTGSSVNLTPGSTQVYTITGSSPANCNGLNTATVTVISTPTIIATSATVCSGQTATLTASGATNYTWTPGAITSATLTATPATTTNYTVIGANGTCASQATATITIGSAVSISINQPTICAGTTVTLTATSPATSYTWNTGANTSSIVVTPTATAGYSVTGISGGCSASGATTVFVNANPTITVNSSTICSGQTATLNALGGTSYTWNPGSLTGTSVNVSPGATQIYTVTGANAAGCTSAVTSTVNVTGSAALSVTSASICTGQTATLVASGATNYTWMPGGTTSATLTDAPATTTNYTVVGANGTCTALATATITVGSAVSVSINQPTICIGETATLTATSPASTYTWNTGANTSSIVVTPTITTSYSVTGTSGGCSASGSTTVFVSASPTITATSATVCTGQSATLTASGATNYTWSPGSVVSTSLTASPATTTSYTVLGVTGNCTAQATATITIGSAVSISVNQPTICAGETATLTATSPATTYTWSTGATTSSIVVSPTVNTVYSVNGTSGSCNATGSGSVTVNSSPTVSIGGGANICSGQTTTLTASGATSYTWEPGTIVSSSIAVSPVANTTYSVTGANLNGCISNTAIAVTVSAAASISVTAPSMVICAGETASLTASGAGTYTWQPGGIVSSSLNVSPLATQNYTVLSASGTCTASSVITVSVNAPSSVSITPSSVPLVCNGSSVTLVASGASSYTWSPGNIVSNAISVSPSVFTTYTVSGGSGNCISFAVQQVSVTSGINFTVNPASIILCSGTRTTITATGAQNYVWLPGNYTGNSVTINPSASVVYTVIGSVGSCTATKTINVSISNVTADFIILNNESDNFGAIQFQNISSGNNINHWYFSNGTDTYATDPAVYFGDPGTYVACLYVKNNKGCSDTLCKVVNVGCAENVVFIPNTFSPNNDGLNDVFRVVTLPQCVVKYRMSIYNSWGQQVFTSDKMDNGWDGTFKGQPADDNVYSYILEYTMDSGRAYRKTGHVMLFK